MPEVTDMTLSETEVIKVSVMLPKSTHKRAKIFAAQQEMPLKDLVAEALEYYMAAHSRNLAVEHGAAA